MPQRALIICNGELPSRKTLKSLLNNTDFIVCADGGANKAIKLGIIPDVIIGDLDSITERTRKHFHKVKIIHDDNQYNTDLEKALDFLLARRIKEITIIAATGGRTDHTLSNLSILGKYHRRAHITMVDDTCEVTVIDGKVSFEGGIGQKVSLLPLGRCKGISTRGLKYPLYNESLELGVREGTSNEIVSSLVEISVRRGSLLLFKVHKR